MTGRAASRLGPSRFRLDCKRTTCQPKSDLIGLALSHALAARLADASLRPVVLTFAALAGVAALAKSIVG